MCGVMPAKVDQRYAICWQKLKVLHFIWMLRENAADGRAVSPI